MGAEAYALFFHFAQFAQAEYLEATGIGQQSAVPAHEFVQPTHFAHQLVPGSEIEVIGIAQNDLRAQTFKDVLRNGLYCPCCSYRHEGRSFYRAVRCMDAGHAGRAGLGLDGERQSHKSLWYRLFLKFRAQRGIPPATVIRLQCA